MSSGNWGNDTAPRPQDAPVSERVRPQRSKKNTRKWCKGKVGVEHSVETVRHHYYSHHRQCHWWEFGVGRYGHTERSWICYHAERCTVCGKYVTNNLRFKCPDFSGAPSDG